MLRRSIGFLSVLALVVLAVQVPVPSHASLSIKPAYVELDLAKGAASKTITVTNTTKQEARFRAQPLHFLYAPNGSLSVVPADEHSLADWLKFNPREFTLAPGASRAIRLTVVPPADLKNGEYWGAIHFEPLQGRMASTEDGQGRAMTLSISTNILVPIVGSIGEVTHACEMTDLKAWKTTEGVAMTAVLANVGQGRFRVKGSYELVDAAGVTVAQGLLGEDTLLSGGERIFSMVAKGDFAAGEYTLRASYESPRLQAPVAGQTPVRAEAPEAAVKASEKTAGK